MCGSDVQIINVPPGHPSTPPVIIGHEFVGWVRAVGSAVRDVRHRAARRRRSRSRSAARATRAAPGDRPTAPTSWRSACTATGRWRATSPPRPTACTRSPTTSRPSSPRSSSRSPASSTARTGPRSGPGESAVVFGAGAIGCLFIAVFRASGAREDRRHRAEPLRAPVARAIGADVVLTPDEWASQRAELLPAGRGRRGRRRRQRPAGRDRGRRRWARGSWSSG